MRNYLLLLLGFPLIAHAQVTGFNGSNFEKNLNAVTTEWMADICPAGDTLVWRFRADKYEAIVPTDMLENVVDLHDALELRGSHLQIVYTFHTRGLSAEDNLFGFNYLHDEGIDLICAEFGNEEYSHYNFDWSGYWNACQPTLLSLHLKYPEFPVSFFLANRPMDSDINGGRNDHNTYNNLAIGELAGKPDYFGFSWHEYNNVKDCPVMVSVPTSRTFDQAAYYEDLDNYYHDLYFQRQEASLSDAIYGYVQAKLPGRDIWVSEFGPFASTGNIQNTWAFHAAEFEYWYENAGRYKALLKHNGLSSENTGCISEEKKTDLPSTDGYVRRLSYWTYQLYRNGKDALPMGAELTAPGQYKLWFVNALRDTAAVSYTLAANLQASISGQQIIVGDNYYSSAGYVEWMKDGSAGLDIPGISSHTGSQLLPLSYGYVELTVTEVAPPPPPVDCKKPWWCGLFPRAKKCNC